MEFQLFASHKKKLGLAPIASFEDLSDEMENGEPATQKLEIKMTTPITAQSSLKTPITPRIDISRASSSSHHEDSSNSRESSPERELLVGAESPPGCKLTLNYKEDAYELRSSTEELDLQDPIHAQDYRREVNRNAKRGKEDGTQSEYGVSTKFQERERKDSNCSDIILLNISGRTSRLSSVGSQGSGHSGKLSVTSNMSSRSPSPHKCLLETSFCGRRPTRVQNLIEPPRVEGDDIEKVLLMREVYATKALIPEGVKVPITDGCIKPDPLDKPRRRGREERKEIFKREVEITKMVLEKANIEVPIIRKKMQARDHLVGTHQEVAKPEILDLSDIKQDSPNLLVLEAKPSVSGEKSEDLSTKSPSTASRKNSFVSLLKVKMDDIILGTESPNSCSKSRRRLIIKPKDTQQSIKNISNSREAPSIDQEVTISKESKSKSLICSTIKLFKKREPKKSFSETTANVSDILNSGCSSTDNMEHVGFSFYSDRSIPSNYCKKQLPISIDLCAENICSENALPSESVSIPLETPTKLLDEYESEHQAASIVTEAYIEHHRELNTKHSICVKMSSDQLLEIKKNSKEATSLQPRKAIIPLTSLKSADAHCTHETEYINKNKCEDGLKPVNWYLEENFGDLKSKVKAQPFQKGHAFEQNEPIIQDSLGQACNVSDLDHNSSESERDSEIDFIKNKAEKTMGELADERRGLFYEESFEEDIFFVPTTLPLDKTVAIPILPIRKRHQEARTIPIERPRSTTPINPTLLDEFVMHTSSGGTCADRIKIYLPRTESCKLKNPRKHATNTFTQFAGKVPDSGKRNMSKTPSSPPVPSRIFSTQPSSWINFEEIPEKRKAPKRIQTIPRLKVERKNSNYNYVQPEECRCHCHEELRIASLRENMDTNISPTFFATSGMRPCNSENCIVPRSSSDRASTLSDSSLERSLSLEDTALHSSLNQYKPFGMDLDVKSNRSSIISQEDMDDT